MHKFLLAVGGIMGMPISEILNNIKMVFGILLFLGSSAVGAGAYYLNTTFIDEDEHRNIELQTQSKIDDIQEQISQIDDMVEDKIELSNNDQKIQDLDEEISELELKIQFQQCGRCQLERAMIEKKKRRIELLQEENRTIKSGN